MAKSFKDIMNTVPVDMTDPDEVTIRNPFGPSNSRGKGSSMVDISDPNAVTLRNPIGKKATAARKAEADKKSKESATAKQIKDIQPTKKQTPSEEPKKQSFGQAFKEARKEGKNKFTFNGKSYTTETAEEKESNKPTPTGNIGSRTMFDDGEESPSYKKGGKAKCMAKGGKVSSASSRGDGCAQRGKTKGRYI